jgi:membrane protein implicated in regulation of membrane protease activity
MIQHIIGLVETKIALVKLEIRQEVSKVISSLIVITTMALLAFFIWFFISFAFALLINAWLDSIYWGFFIIAGFHILLLLLLYVFRKELKLEETISKEMDKILKINQEEDEQG